MRRIIAICQAAFFAVLSLSAAGSAVTDIRVAPLLETKWSQATDSPFGEEGAFCYNYYTPKHYDCGCVATAAAQVMYHHRFPAEDVAPRTYACEVEREIVSREDGFESILYDLVELTLLGGVYDFGSMPTVPADGTTLAQRQAIGKLTSDIGIACQSSYSSYGSSAGCYRLASALMDAFGYANAKSKVSTALSDEEFMSAIIPNLDAGLPVVVSVNGSGGAHAIVADGYGYANGEFHVHVNMGWAGIGDGWYALSSILPSENVDGLVYNIYPTGLPDNVICSGRVLSESGSPIPGATVSVTNAAVAVRGTCTTDANGIYALILPPGEHEIVAKWKGTSSRQTILLEACDDAWIDGSVCLDEGTVRNRRDIDFAFADQLNFRLTGEVEPVPAGSFVAATYDGYLVDANNSVVGTIRVVAASKKTNRRTGLVTSRVGIRVQLAGYPKIVSISGTYDLSSGVVQSLTFGGRTVELLLGSDGMTGRLGDFNITGARNRYSSKDVEDKQVVTEADELTGAYAIVWEESGEDAAGTPRLQGWNALTVSIAKKGKVKVSGTLADGTKVSASAQMIVGAERCCIPVVYSKKNVSFAFTIRLRDDGDEVVGLDGAIFGKAGNLARTSAFSLDVSSLVSGLSSSTTTVLSDYLPDGVGIALNGAKWIVMPDENGKAMKAGKLVWDKKVNDGAGGIGAKSNIDGYNISGLKLTFTAKTGAFKGSFKVYTVVNNKLKNTTVSVSGVVIDGIGYGMATIKKVGTFAVRIE